jgi:hypothetical protein
MTGFRTNAQGQIIHVFQGIYQGTVVYVKSDPTRKKYFVTKVNPKNVNIEDEAGGKFFIAKTGVERHDDQDFTRAPSAPLPEAYLGTVVRFTGASAARFPGDYVVVSVPRDPEGRYKFAKLGGDRGRTVTGPLSGVEVV